jgi:fumarate hydratase class II
LHTLLESISLLAEASASFDTHCIAGLNINREAIARHLDRSLMLVTALTPRIGYARAGEVVQLAQAQDLTIRQAALQLGVLDAATLDELLAPERMTTPTVER